MRGIAVRCAPGRPLLVTAFSTISIHPDTQRQIEAECPNWLNMKRDRRTKETRRLLQMERDITALAEAMWITGDELTEI